MSVRLAVNLESPRLAYRLSAYNFGFCRSLVVGMALGNERNRDVEPGKNLSDGKVEKEVADTCQSEPNRTCTFTFNINGTK